LIDVCFDHHNKAMIDKTKTANAVLAQRIAQAIESSGKTAKAIAEEVQVKPQAVNGWKTTGRIGKDTLVRFALAVNRDPMEFLDVLESTQSVASTSKRLSAEAKRLINEIIAAEEQGSSSPQLIEALTKVLHVAIPKATDNDYPKLRDEF
jgi:hypothetical protein